MAKKVQKTYIEKEHILKNITETLEENYMPYAMSVIVSRAIPEIDGFKPSHRKLLYTMYKEGLLNKDRTKSANIVGATMKLNPHGDGAIYETMVRLSRGYEALLYPFVDSKGNFGKHYSRDMAYAASRYTEAKLAPICHEIFDEIDKDTVDFVPNYDGSLKEPVLLPVSFPTILTNSNQGIAVGMASSICSFNLGEVCDTVIEYMKDENFNLSLTLKAPDFSTGGQIIVDGDNIEKIYQTGRGTFKVRSKYEYIKSENRILITEIPYTTTIEAIIDKVIELIKSNKLREISDIKDMSDLNGLKISIELKRSADPEKVMAKLFKSTPLEDSFGCNFNILIAGTPKVMGVREIIDEWLAFRTDCIKRKTFYSLEKAKDKLHLLKGLEKILLDIDKAVKIVRETKRDIEVVPNLMIGFGIDEIQAEFIADIKLRNLNEEYILNKTKEISDLVNLIDELESILKNKKKIYKLIEADLLRAKKKYSSERKTQIIYNDDIVEYDETEHIEDYNCILFLSKESYFKKITAQSLRMNDKQTLKDGDKITQRIETTNKSELIFFTDMQNAYKTKAHEFNDCKASVLGDFLPVKLSMDAGENVKYMVCTNDYSGYMLFFFENGKCAKVPLSSYKTLTNRKKLINAYGDKSPLVGAFFIEQDEDFVVYSSNNKVLIVSSALIPLKTTKSTQGVNVMTQKGKNKVTSVEKLTNDILNPNYYKTKNIPAVGHFLREQDFKSDQIKLF